MHVTVLEFIDLATCVSGSDFDVLKCLVQDESVLRTGVSVFTMKILIVEGPFRYKNWRGICDYQFMKEYKLCEEIHV